MCFAKTKPLYFSLLAGNQAEGFWDECVSRWDLSRPPEQGPTSKAKDGQDRFAASSGRSLRLGTALHPSPAGGARRDNEDCKVRNHANSS